MKKFTTLALSLLFASQALADVTVTPPADLKTETYEMYCNDVVYGPFTFSKVQIGFDGEDVYLGNFGYYGDMLGAWLKGKVNGDMLVFPNEQCFYEEKGEEYYAYGAKVNGGETTTMDFEMKFDKDAGICTSDMHYIVTIGKDGEEMEHLEAIVLMSYEDGKDDPKDDGPEIINYADGEPTLYMRSGYSWQYTMYGISMNDQDGSVMTIVKDKDGKTVYLQDIICGTNEKTYVKGELSEDGTKISVATGQFVHFNTKEQWGHKLAMLNYDEKVGTYIPDDTPYAVYTIKDGVISLEDTDNDYKGEEGVYPKRIFGLIYEDLVDASLDEKWSGFGDVSTVLTPAKGGDIELPDGLKIEDYALTYDKLSYQLGTIRQGNIIKVGIVDKEIYIQGLSKDMPEAWVKGNIDGDKVIIPNGQKLGVMYQYMIYLLNAKKSMKYDETYGEEYVVYDLVDGDIVLNFDAENKRIYSDDADQVLIINAGDAEVYYLSLVINPDIYPYVEQAATPATPRVANVIDYFDDLGYIITDNYIPTFDVNGKFIDANKMTYKVYFEIDGEEELFVFYPDEYMLIEKEMTEIPYNFYDGMDIYTGASSIFFYQSGMSNIGIQSIYYGGGECHESEIGWFKPKSPTAIESVIANPGKAIFYDLNGRRSNGQQNGIIIKSKDGKAVKMIGK